MRVGERAAVCCVTYVCACKYGLLDVADACRNRHFHDYMQVPLMWPMPAVTVTPSLPRLHLRNLRDTRLEIGALKSYFKIERRSALKEKCPQRSALNKSGDIFLSRIFFSEREYQIVSS